MSKYLKTFIDTVFYASMALFSSAIIGAGFGYGFMVGLRTAL